MVGEEVAVDRGVSGGARGTITSGDSKGSRAAVVQSSGPGAQTLLLCLAGCYPGQTLSFCAPTFTVAVRKGHTVTTHCAELNYP